MRKIIKLCKNVLFLCFFSDSRLIKFMGYDIKMTETSLLNVKKSKVKVKISYENLNIFFFNIVRKLKYNNTTILLEFLVHQELISVALI